MKEYISETFNSANLVEPAKYINCKLRDCQVSKSSEFIGGKIESSFIGRCSRFVEVEMNGVVVDRSGYLERCSITASVLREGSSVVECKMKWSNAGDKCRFRRVSFTSFPYFLNRSIVYFRLDSDETVKLALQILLRHFELLEDPEESCRRYLRNGCCPFTQEGITPFPHLKENMIKELKPLLVLWVSGNIDIMGTERMNEREFIKLLCKITGNVIKEE